MSDGKKFLITATVWLLILLVALCFVPIAGIVTGATYANTAKGFMIVLGVLGSAYVAVFGLMGTVMFWES